LKTDDIRFTSARESHRPTTSLPVERTRANQIIARKSLSTVDRQQLPGNSSAFLPVHTPLCHHFKGHSFYYSLSLSLSTICTNRHSHHHSRCHHNRPAQPFLSPCPIFPSSLDRLRPLVQLKRIIAGDRSGLHCHYSSLLDSTPLFVARCNRTRLLFQIESSIHCDSVTLCVWFANCLIKINRVSLLHLRFLLLTTTTNNNLITDFRFHSLSRQTLG
jgi:hypothetical protein